MCKIYQFEETGLLMRRPRAAPDSDEVEIKNPITASSDSDTSHPLLLATELLRLTQV